MVGGWWLVAIGLSLSSLMAMVTWQCEGGCPIGGGYCTSKHVMTDATQELMVSTSELNLGMPDMG